MLASTAAGGLAGCANAPALPPVAAITEPAPSAPVASDKVSDMVQKARALAFAPRDAKEGAQAQDRIDVAMLALRAKPAATQRAELSTRIGGDGAHLSPDEVRARIDGLAQHQADGAEQSTTALSHEETMRRLRDLASTAARQRATAANRSAFGELKPFPSNPDGQQTASVQP